MKKIASLSFWRGWASTTKRQNGLFWFILSHYYRTFIKSFVFKTRLLIWIFLFSLFSSFLSLNSRLSETIISAHLLMNIYSETDLFVFLTSFFISVIEWFSYYSLFSRHRIQGLAGMQSESVTEHGSLPIPSQSIIALCYVPSVHTAHGTAAAAVVLCRAAAAWGCAGGALECRASPCCAVLVFVCAGAVGALLVPHPCQVLGLLPSHFDCDSLCCGRVAVG